MLDRSIMLLLIVLILLDCYQTSNVQVKQVEQRQT